jgi:OmcA/MtrC family decaheme c-type cytochrome
MAGRWTGVRWGALLGALAVAGCEGPAGADGVGCTLITNDDGSSTLSCRDGTRLVLRSGENGMPGAPGANGMPCTVSTDDAGTRTIRCADGTTATVSNGSNGSNCTVAVDADSGVRTIRCADGTTAAVTNGANGTNGTNGTSGGNVRVTDHHGSDFLLSNGAYANGAKVLARATINRVDADPSGRVTVYFRVTDRSDRPIATVPSISANIAKLLPQGTTDGTNRWVPYIYRTQTVTGTGSWPADAGTTAIQANRENNGTLTNHRDGTYTYVFATNLTTAMMGTTPVTYERNRTHRVVIMMGGSSGATADAFFDFVPNGEPLTERRDIIETASCQSCHGANEFRGHGGDRLQIQTCASCHVPGLVDPHGGENLDLAPMVHRIHMGSELPSVRGPDGVTYDNPATPANEAADNRSYRIWGNGNALHTYDHVGFPAVIANCTKCHQGTGAQVDNWLRHPTRAACGSCHDNVNFATGQNHPFGAVQTNDANCFMCHDVAGGATSIRAAHDWTTQDPRNLPEFTAQLAVSRPANGTHFVAGESPVVTLALSDRVSGMLLDHTTVIEDAVAEPCLAPPGACAPRDGAFRTASLFVHGPRGNRAPVLTTAARAQVFSTVAGPWDLSATTANLVVRFDQGQDIRVRAPSGADSTLAANVTVLASAGTFANRAAATVDEVVTWLNANAAFRARGIAWNDSGRLGLRSRNKGAVFAIQLQASTLTTAAFGGDTTVRTPTGSTVANNISRRTNTANNDPKASWSASAITYRLDPVDDLAPGTYVVSIEFADHGRTDATNYVTPTVARVVFQVGTATEERPPAGNCDSCHEGPDGRGFMLDPSRHNKIFNDSAIDQCGACHDNQPQSVTGANFTGAQPISRRVHAIHYGSSLNYPLSTVAYSNGDPIPGRNWQITFPQDVRNCETCHQANTTSGSWRTRAERIACSGCHDSNAAMTHMRLQTLDPTPADPWSGDEQESCTICH